MTLQQLIYAVETYRCGSITKAAETLFMAQPNLSTAIRTLEDEIGVQIFRRTAKGIECTDSGREFINHAIEIVTRFERLQNFDRQGKSSKSLSVITARSSEACFSMIQYISNLSKQDLSFRIMLKENTNFDVIESVASGEVDLGILRANSADAAYFFKMAELKNLQIIRLSSAPYVVLFSKNHPLAGESYITQDMLAPYIEVVHGDYELPMYPFSNYKYHRYQQNEDGKKVIFVYDRGTLMDILANVEGSYVWTSTTHTALKDRHGLVELSCDAPAVEGIDAIVINRSKSMTAEMREFINLLLKKAGQPPLK